jgi:hypothetical protein
VSSAEFDDVIRVMYCTSSRELQLRFQRLMDAIASVAEIDQKVRACMPVLE